MDVAAVPVVGEALDDDAVLLDALDPLEGPGADRAEPNLSPIAAAALGDTIMPARSVSWAISGAKGTAKSRRTVSGSTTVMALIWLISPLRREPGSSGAVPGCT